MDPRANPYTPNAGATPPALAGREQELTSFDVLLTRLERGYPEQSMIITGLRGVGKTVLLGAFRTRAEGRNWATIEAEITKSAELGPKIAQLARRALLQISPKTRWGERARRAAATLKSFSLTMRPDGSLALGLDVDAAEGVADSGDLSEDLTDVVLALGDAAQDQDRGVIFLFDEIQFLAQRELEALIAALHRSVQRNLPITFVGAGLPQIPRLAGEAKSYAERLFRFPSIGKLDRPDAVEALVAPAREAGVEYDDAAVDHILEYTQGYPYFLQEYGKVVWDEAPESPIRAGDVTECLPIVEANLDGGFFRVRTDRVTDLELQYLRAMAELGPDAQRAAEVARVLHRTSEQLGPTRSRLIEKGLLYTPGHGLAAFTVPQFDQYMKRSFDLTIPRSRPRGKRK